MNGMRMANVGIEQNEIQIKRGAFKLGQLEFRPIEKTEVSCQKQLLKFALQFHAPPVRLASLVVGSTATSAANWRSNFTCAG